MKVNKRTGIHKNLKEGSMIFNIPDDAPSTGSGTDDVH
jgi:hypothetical protein